MLSLGITSTHREQIFIGDADRPQHIYGIGQTGTGKTNWLLSLMLQDLRSLMLQDLCAG